MALLAVVPAALFAVGRSLLAVVAALNVVLIFGSLYLLTSPTEGEGHAEESHDETADTDGKAVETSDSTV